MFRVGIVENPMPAGSRDPEVLLNWILDTMTLVRRKSEDWADEDGSGALGRIFREALLVDPLKGWDTREIGEVCGLSQTGTHHQMIKLRESGLVATDNNGKWHVHVLRGGSMKAAISLVGVQAKSLLEMRLAELSEFVIDSETRMENPSDGDFVFSIRISEPRPRRDGDDSIDSLVEDLGLKGGRAKEGDRIAKKLICELGSSHNPITILSLAERFDESRSRVQRSIERMRVAGLVERVPMIERIAQDVFAGISRQYDGRGEAWLMTRGGLGRLDDKISSRLLKEVKEGTLSIDKVQKILSPVPLEEKRVLLNTIGGRMPFGYRMAGRNGDEVAERVMRRLDRTLSRLITIADRLDECLVSKD